MYIPNTSYMVHLHGSYSAFAMTNLQFLKKKSNGLVFLSQLFFFYRYTKMYIWLDHFLWIKQQKVPTYK